MLPQVASGGGSAAARTFDLGTSSVNGIFRTCYCVGPSGCDADDASIFTHPAGDLTVRGPDDNQDQACTAGVGCTVGAFTGTALSTDDKLALVAEAPWSATERAVAPRFDNPRATVPVLVLG